jgi:hypothetical protein
MQQFHFIIVYRHKGNTQFIVKQCIRILYPAFAHGFRHKISRIGNQKSPFRFEQFGGFYHVFIPIPENEQVSSCIKRILFRVIGKSFTGQYTGGALRCGIIPQEFFS